ncbi:unnamed protein product [Schistosoma curassoni]|uniref:Oxidation resistance protein 1 n=1 Tax=Schistosoma curassoni TaxID=6186 RepID=A0A183JIB5_9TREM|nr:unnamed protein product [Schistosoma curassoni]
MQISNTFLNLELIYDRYLGFCLLLQNLTPDAEGLDWILTYSTSVHGFSLRSLYRRCANSLTESSKDNLHSTIHTKMKHTLIPNSPHASNQPCILIIRTSTNEIFGAMLNTHPYPSNGRFYGNGSCFVFRWINTTDSKQDQLKENSNSINEQDSTSLSVTSNKLMNIPVDVNSASISSSVLLVTDNHNSDLVSSSSSFDMRTETVTKEFAHLCYDDKREFPEQDKKQTFQITNNLSNNNDNNRTDRINKTLFITMLTRFRNR